MNITPSLEEALAFAEDERYSVLPLSCEMLADRLTPIQALKILKNVSISIRMNSPEACGSVS